MTDSFFTIYKISLASIKKSNYKILLQISTLS